MQKIYGIIPVPVFYVDDLGKFAGMAHGIYVRIKKGYEEDAGLLEHELQHCRQFYRTLMLHPLMYKFSPAYRYRAELECYRIQLQYAKNKERAVKHFARYLINNYNLDLDAAKVERDLSK